MDKYYAVNTLVEIAGRKRCNKSDLQQTRKALTVLGLSEFESEAVERNMGLRNDDFKARPSYTSPSPNQKYITSVSLINH